MKTKVNLSLDFDTAERLKQYAFEQHKTVSQAVTDWIWREKITDWIWKNDSGGTNE